MSKSITFATLIHSNERVLVGYRDSSPTLSLPGLPAWPARIEAAKLGELGTNLPGGVTKLSPIS